MILVGTASWTDKTLVDSGLFYPPEAKTPESRLRYYAERFGLVEIDSTYYALPAPKTAELWAERTPDHFVFNAKAFRLFTGHHAAPRALPPHLRDAIPAETERIYYRHLPEEVRVELWRLFREGLEPLRRSGKLGAILLQFAPWVIANREGFALVQRAAEALEGLRVATEFRNRSWFTDKSRDRVLAFEREHALCHVVVDEPSGFASSIPQVWAVTNPELAIVRFHGRNRETWTQKGISAAERFNYLYSPAELSEFVDPIRRLSSEAQSVHALFNNCYQDSAQRNATDFTRLLKDSGAPVAS